MKLIGLSVRAVICSRMFTVGGIVFCVSGFTITEAVLVEPPRPQPLPGRMQHPVTRCILGHVQCLILALRGPGLVWFGVRSRSAVPAACWVCSVT